MHLFRTEDIRPKTRKIGSRFFSLPDRVQDIESGQSIEGQVSVFFIGVVAELPVK